MTSRMVSIEASQGFRQAAGRPAPTTWSLAAAQIPRASALTPRHLVQARSADRRRGLRVAAALNAPGQKMPAKRPFVPHKGRKGQTPENDQGQGGAVEMVDSRGGGSAPVASSLPAPGPVTSGANSKRSSRQGSNGASSSSHLLMPAGGMSRAEEKGGMAAVASMPGSDVDKGMAGRSSGSGGSRSAGGSTGWAGGNGAANGGAHGGVNGGANSGANGASSGRQKGASDGPMEDDEEPTEGLGVTSIDVLRALQRKANVDAARGSGEADGEAGGLTLGNLINMVKDAEQNILLLNRVRSKALAELSNARMENTALQNQLRVFQARIAESDARLTMVSQARQRSSVLEDQLHLLQERLDMAQEASSGVEEMRAQMGALQKRVIEGEMAAAQLGLVSKEKEQLEAELSGVRQQLVLLGTEKAESEQRWRDQVDATRLRMGELQGFLVEAEVQVKELSEAVEMNKQLSAELVQMKALLQDKEQQLQGLQEATQEKVKELQDSSMRELQSKQAEAEEASRKLAGSEAALEGLQVELRGVKETLGQAQGELEVAKERAQGRDKEASRLTKELEGVRAELQARVSRLEAAEAATEEVKGSLAAVEEELQGLRRESEERERELVARTQMVAGLQREVEAAARQLDAREEEVARLGSALSRVEEDKERLQGDVRRLARVVEEKTAGYLQVEKTRDELRIRARELELEFRKVQEEAEERAAALREAKGQIAQGAKDAEALKVRLEAAESGSAAAEAEVEALIEQLREKEEEEEEVSAAMLSREEEAAKAAEEIQELKNQMEAKEAEVARVQQEMEQVQGQLRTVKKALEVSVREDESFKTQAKKEKEQMRQQAQALEKQLREKADAEREAKQVAERLQSQLLGREEELAKVAAALAAEQEEGVTVRAQAAELRGQLKDKDAELAAVAKVREGLQGQLRALKASLEGREEEAEEEREQVEEKQRKEMEALRTSTVELNAQLRAAETQAEVLQAELKGVQKQLSDKEQELGTVKGELGTVQGELGTLKEQLSAAEGRGQKLALELQQAQSKSGVGSSALAEAKEEQARLQELLDEAKAALETARDEMAAQLELSAKQRKGQQGAAVARLEVEAELLKEKLDGAERAAKKQREEVDAALRQLRQKDEVLREVQAVLAQERDAKGQVGQLQAQLGIVQADLAKALSERSGLALEASTLRTAVEVKEKEVQAVREEVMAERDGAVRALQAEVDVLRRQAIEKEAALEASQRAALLASAQESDKKVLEVTAQLGKENDALQMRLKELKIKAEEDFRARKEKEQELLKRQGELERRNADLQARVVALEAESARLATLLQGATDVEREVKRLQMLVGEGEQLKEAAGLVAEENRLLQGEVVALREALAGLEAESAQAVGLAQEEAELVRSQVEVLKQELLDTDDLMRAQLEAYQGELLSLQQLAQEAEELQQMQYERGVAAGALAGRTPEQAAGLVLPGLEGREQVGIGLVPWEFWSSMLLKVDELQMVKLLKTSEATMLRQLVWHRDRELADGWQEWQTWKDDKAVAAGMRGLVDGEQPPGRQILHVVHIAAEMAPVAKVGGLGDVVTGLCRALQQRGHLVEVILPKYDCMDYSRIDDLQMVDIDFKSYFDGQMHSNRIWRGMVEGLPVHFIEPHHPARFFWRGTFYGCQDDFKRFTYFCRAALDFLLLTGKKPDIIHTHDWQTAVVAPLYWDVFVPKGLNSAQLFLTCHNFEYQGTEHHSALASCGLDVARQRTPERMQDNYLHDRVNLLKGGIVYCNMITTVSPTYAMEVRGPDNGRGLHLTLAQHSSKFSGVLNGIDNDVWDPQTDELIHVQYGVEDAQQGKAENKQQLKSILRLSSNGNDASKPLVGCVTRLVPQKGVALIRHAIFRTRERGGQFVLLGSSPVPDIQRDFENLAQELQHDQNVRLVLKYDEGLSHLIFAGCDCIIIPSLFEPCGLTQLIAMRYGTIPIARKTGGLADSVFDVDDPSIPALQRNGFAFTAADNSGLNYALDRALSSYYDKPQWWDDLVTRAMEMDFSWNESCSHYVALYLKAIATKGLPG